MSTNADVFVNGIKVGSMPQAIYRKIVSEVRHDLRPYAGQLLNLAKVAVIGLLISLVALLLVIAFIVGAESFTSPNDLASTLTWFANRDSADVVWLIRAFVYAFGTVFVWYLVVCGALNRLPGFVNCFDVMVARELRTRLNIAADGYVLVECGPSHLAA